METIMTQFESMSEKKILLTISDAMNDRNAYLPWVTMVTLFLSLACFFFSSVYLKYLSAFLL